MKLISAPFASRLICRAALAAVLATALSPIAALATTVSPVMVDLQSGGRQVVANISVNNSGANPLPVEIVVTKLKATATGFEQTKENTDDLLVVPPLALIPPGQTQTFRVQWIGDPDVAESSHYYVGINQVPVKLPEGKSAVQVVYNFQVLTSVSSPRRKASLVIRAAAPTTIAEGKLAAAITVENMGDAHDYLSQHRIKISETDASGNAVFEKTISGSEFQQLIGYGLVASHTTRTVNIPLALPTSKGTVTAVLMDEQAQ